jgi:hypothetical protein
MADERRPRTGNRESLPPAHDAQSIRDLGVGGLYAVTRQLKG